ncbi:hypothetical protein P7C73_g1461, partial [Tremellales sp. Uapishka_1]
MVQAASASTNIWVAASDGDLARVQYLIEVEHLSPNVLDSNSYSPMHAAASYSHLELLAYLLSQGGDINLPDADGDTPLYTVESVSTAEWLIQHGADASHQNDEGLTAGEALQEDHPDIAAYLLSLTTSSTLPPNPSSAQPQISVSELAVDNYASEQTAALLQQTKEIMEAAERDGVSPDAQLRQVVERAVRDGLTFGGELGGQDQGGGEEEHKRSRVD